MSAFRALNTFKIVSMVALFVLLSSFEICDFCTPTNRPSCSCVRLRSCLAVFIIRPKTSIRSSYSYSSLSAVPNLRCIYLSCRPAYRFSFLYLPLLYFFNLFSKLKIAVFPNIATFLLYKFLQQSNFNKVRASLE
jgi:hypothetical protein